MMCRDADGMQDFAECGDIARCNVPVNEDRSIFVRTCLNTFQHVGMSENVGYIPNYSHLYNRDNDH